MTTTPPVLTRRAALGLLAAVATGCTAGPSALSGGTGPAATTAPPTTPPPKPVVTVAYAPTTDATGVSPVAPVTVTTTRGTITALTLTNPDGKAVAGALAPGGASWSTTEVLGYGKTYTWSGTAVGSDGLTAPVSGSFATLDPSTTGAVLNPLVKEGATVGIAMPVMLQFDGKVSDKAAAEKALTVTTSPETVGSWAWLPDSNGGARAHWRAKSYFAAGTTVTVTGAFYGLDLGGGRYGASDVSSTFTVGRNQVVKADTTSHTIVIERDGSPVSSYPVSYGKADLPRNVTRSGIHVVNAMDEMVLMTNIPGGYENVEEHWAVRISNNGEFIHANPSTVGVQGSSNVSNGCVNMSSSDAQQYFGTAMIGDPVEVTGTTIDLSAADGDIYDWALSWATWTSMSALA
ncbi:Ig-like domain-containing protein [Rhodococcus antarcticus]|jgi:lipoprotein-anchoring transpeptidase ErfK/SrfK|uniref:Ig-like domain-containing protein n=1 Tax=Rhodococcus antarcticus TaxID=2987751 RepID=A0ABY6NZC0_9NOCA|nr:Ig-like domain-containing protein [Rhodococcus antarcticus]UZJ24735.1 Ig-like domain-containing protein [Rhodococcus antarcticus]